MDRDPRNTRLVPSLDGRHHARDAMTRAVNREGAQVLSNPKRLGSFIDDELAGLPRERALLLRAVEVQVPGIIRGAASQTGPERAIELAAATLYALHGRDPDGCLWVAAEMARLLGYRPGNQLSISEWTGQTTVIDEAREPVPLTPIRTRPDPARSRPEPAIAPAPAPAEPEPPPALTVPTAVAATAPPPAPPSLLDQLAPDQLLPDPAPPPAAPPSEAEPIRRQPPPASDLANNPYFPRGRNEQAGNQYFPRERNEPADNPYFPRSPGGAETNPYFPWSEPEPGKDPLLSPAPPAGGYLPPPTGFGDYEASYKPARRRLLRPTSIVGALASLVLIYFALAGIFLLPPYSQAKQNPAQVTVPPGRGSASAEQALLSHIPAGIQPMCQQPGSIANEEVVASVTCAVTSTAGDEIGIVYDQFGTAGSAKGAFDTDLRPGAEDWGPQTALANTSSCDPGQDPNFNGLAGYSRAASATVTSSDSGQVACWVSSAEEPTIDWTSANRTIDANAAILRPTGSAPPTPADEANLYQFWLTEAGPQ